RAGRLAHGPAGPRGLADADSGRVSALPARSYPQRMAQVSTAVAAVRDAIRRHPWWTDSLLAAFLTLVSVASAVVCEKHSGLPVAVAATMRGGGHPGPAIPELAVFAIAWVLGDNIRTRRAYLAELEARAARLEREREERDERAVTEERSRIARELHDVIAHNVSVMVVQASAGEELFDTSPERARESLSS